MKPKRVYHELWVKGPVQSEARRLAYEELKRNYANKNLRFDMVSKGEQERAITVLLFNAQEVFYNRAKKLV
jgi:hypothetical protein